MKVGNETVKRKFSGDRNTDRNETLWEEIDATSSVMRKLENRE